ncbi:hypothetical protein CONPUDRAFT_72204 [Coniophora puteana RWD-64-598 SS2]|uniref:Uncharacterized protein n=1 Tax=Coniophora puteana (strain RWD-64-598) TaxID=741705 RepID=A0A5M3MRM9_CONPW|nr:uncharacterized protein CONPUDRAFT_72204 [Coniophora puteana RWD-64-598 SS2]EIW81818.1 hypothetical protein CONPUDRAFT_72204 [Coniophora puteana RWD-64-598 SS2]
MPFPKLVAFETSDVLFATSPSLRDSVWGKGTGASNVIADNVERIDWRLLRDKSNHQNTTELYEDTSKIISDVLKNGAELAIVSRNDNKKLCDRILYYYHTTDPKTQQEKPIISLVKYDEVSNESKTNHFERIHGWTKFAYKDMVGLSLIQ